MNAVSGACQDTLLQTKYLLLRNSLCGHEKVTLFGWPANVAAIYKRSVKYAFSV